MRPVPHRYPHGFTLTDLLVVTALIGVLVPIVLPALAQTRQASGVAQCLSNMEQLMQATSAYRADWDGAFPFQTVGGGQGVCSWSYGGKTTDDYWKDQGPFFLRVTERPLNLYLLGAAVEPDVMDGYEIVERTEVPVLKCPADHQTHQNMFDNPAAQQRLLSCYDDVGTSYQYNLHSLFDLNKDSQWYWQQDGWAKASRLLIHDVLAKYSSTFVMFLEDPMAWALFDNTLEIGNHGEFAKHSCGYLDGHADYGYRDTRTWCGPDWEALNPEWVFDFYSPKPIYYVQMDMTCLPAP